MRYAKTSMNRSAAASDAGLLTAVDPGRKQNPVKGGTKMSYRFGLMTLCGGALIALAGCKFPATPTGVLRRPANSPGMNLSGFLFVPPFGVPAVGATASMDFRVNNVFTAP